MKVAICTTDGTKVDLHFGKTATFFIYETETGEKKFLEKRVVEAYCPSEKFLTDDEIHSFEEERFENIYNTISDCTKICAVDIGDVPKRKLEEKGISVQKCNCTISTCKCI